jgi:hypothetical protein
MSILELLVKAKKLYLENQGKAGMCWCIKVIANEGKSREEQRDRGQVPYANIVSQIPEFNPYFLEAPIIALIESGVYFEIGLEFWWDIDSVGSRINAFDKLIKVYEDIDKEFVW